MHVANAHLNKGGRKSGSNDIKVSNFLYDTSNNFLLDKRIIKLTVRLKENII
jgi:hypothetical protein